MKEKKSEKSGEGFRPKARYAIPFFLVLVILTVVSFIIPLRPDQSYSEKRPLAEFPEFSLESLASGDYFDEISLWFADTFPGRELWINLSRKFQSFHGKSDVLIQGEIPPDDPFETIPMPTGTEASTQPLETTVPGEEHPEETTVPEDILQEVTAPETPIEEWGGLNVENAFVDVGAVIQIDDFAFGYFSFVEQTSGWYASAVNKLAEKLDGTGVTLISAPPPTAIGIMVEKEYMEMLGCEYQDEALDYLHGLMDERVVTVDTVRNLIKHNDEYLFYRTDHHWGPLAAYYTYEQIMQTLGREPAKLEDFEALDQGEFRGSLYYRCTDPSRLTPDNVIAYKPSGDISTMLYDSDGSGFPWDLISDMSKSDVGSKYMTFLAGDHALSVVTNESNPDGPTCLIVKDSYGNCFVPFMVQDYYKVYAIDYRKYSRLSISEFVKKYEIDDVILLPNLGAIQNAEVCKLFQNLCR